MFRTTRTNSPGPSDVTARPAKSKSTPFVNRRSGEVQREVRARIPQLDVLEVVLVVCHVQFGRADRLGGMVHELRDHQVILPDRHIGRTRHELDRLRPVAPSRPSLSL